MSTPLMRVSAENGTKCADGSKWCSRIPYCLASTTIERPSGVSSASEAICAASASAASSTPGIGTNSVASRLPSVIVPVLSSSSTSTSPEASTERPDSASTLRRTRRSMPAMPMADSRAPIVVGISATSSAISVAIETLVSANSLNGRSVTTTTRKISVRPGEQDAERDLVRRLAPRRALDERDHAVEEALARELRDLDDDPVREHLGAAGDRAAVATGLADDRGRLAGDRRLVHRGDALDDRSVAGDELARLDHDDVAARAARRPASRSRRAGARPSRCASRAARPPGPCRDPRRAPRRGWRRRRSARARSPP